MKLIDLFVKIANGEKTPNIIKLGNMIFKTNGKEYNYYCTEENKLLEESFILEDLNDEIEVIEDTPKEYINVSEEQVLFNNLSYEEQQFILKQMRMLQPCKLKNNGE